MKQQAFIDANQPRWHETESIVASVEKGNPGPELGRFPALFRELCADLALARQRLYSSALCSHLNGVVIRSRSALASGTRGGIRSIGRLLAQEFPRTMRAEWRLFAVAMALFWVPFGLLIWAGERDPRWIFAILSPGEMKQMDEMYGADTLTSIKRDNWGEDFGMFGFYIMNNVSIGLKMVALGIPAAIGSVFGLAWQGMMLGAMTGYVHHGGNLERFYTFTCGHSALELIGIVICGMAGMRLGLSVLAPGGLPRRQALAAGARRALPLIYGGALMIFAAAFVEGFWSASGASRDAKYAVGAVSWLLLTGYFVFAGRTWKGGTA